MDNSGGLFLIIIIIGIAILYVIGSSSSNTPERRGVIGESKITALIADVLRRNLYGYVLNNLYVVKADGGTTEIDMLLVCTKGLFVFESKNYTGWIFGDDKHKYWTVTLYAGKDLLGFKNVEKHKFYNPIWQNDSHIKHLRRILGNTVPMNSVIVFSDRCELKRVVNNSEAKIIQARKLKRYLTNVRISYPDVLSTEAVDRIYSQLLIFTDIDGVKKQNHLTHLKEQKNDPIRCPRCGGNLVVRTAKKGANAGQQFYGCSNYPNCRYTRNIE